MDARILNPWQAGDPIEASRLNEIQEVLQSVTHGPHVGTSFDDNGLKLFWVRLKEWIGPESNFVDRKAARQFYDTATDKWKDCDPEEEITLTTDPFASMAYPTGMIIPVQAHGGGKYVPLWAGLVTLDGYLDEALEPGGTATMSIHWRNSSGTYVDTGVNVEVCASPLLPDDADDIPSGSFVTATFHPPRGASFPAYWDVVQSECGDAGGGE
jgi:hypothetical protein